MMQRRQQSGPCSRTATFVAVTACALEGTSLGHQTCRGTTTQSMPKLGQNGAVSGAVLGVRIQLPALDAHFFGRTSAMNMKGKCTNDSRDPRLYLEGHQFSEFFGV
jgi:hypothetical protein